MNSNFGLLSENDLDVMKSLHENRDINNSYKRSPTVIVHDIDESQHNTRVYDTKL